MSNLFEQNGAVFSDCRRYRYKLWRIWDDQKPLIMFVGLNPSTANEMSDDPTIRRVKKFAFDWGFGGVYMMNLFAWVTPYPEELITSENSIGENDMHLLEVSRKCSEIIFAWGSFKEAIERAEQVKAMFPQAKALIINRDGSPRHPLYVRSQTVPVYYCK